MTSYEDLLEILELKEGQAAQHYLAGFEILMQAKVQHLKRLAGWLGFVVEESEQHPGRYHFTNEMGQLQFPLRDRLIYSATIDECLDWLDEKASARLISSSFRGDQSKCEARAD